MKCWSWSIRAQHYTEDIQKSIRSCRSWRKSTSTNWNYQSIIALLLYLHICKLLIFTTFSLQCFAVLVFLTCFAWVLTCFAWSFCGQYSNKVGNSCECQLLVCCIIFLGCGGQWFVLRHWQPQRWGDKDCYKVYCDQHLWLTLWCFLLIWPLTFFNTFLSRWAAAFNNFD